RVLHYPALARLSLELQVRLAAHPFLLRLPRLPHPPRQLAFHRLAVGLVEATFPRCSSLLHPRLAAFAVPTLFRFPFPTIYIHLSCPSICMFAFFFFLLILARPGRASSL